MATVLVTGSLGTVGKPLVEELKMRGHQVWQCDLPHSGEIDYFRADVASYRQMEKVFAKVLPDYVYHLAAEFGRINGEEFYEQVWASNAIGTRNVLELCRMYGGKLIFASSSEIYGDSASTELTEDLPNVQALYQSNDYAISKWVNELQVMNFEKRHGVEAVRCRFFNAYGPGENYHPYRSVVCLFCYRALNSIPYEVYEDYHRVFMFIDDFIPTLANVCDNFQAGEVYNIGGKEYRSVRDLSDLVLSTLGYNDELVTYLPEDTHNVVNKRPDISKAVADLGHNPVVPLEEGVPRTLEWMIKQYKLTVIERMKIL